MRRGGVLGVMATGGCMVYIGEILKGSLWRRQGWRNKTKYFL